MKFKILAKGLRLGLLSVALVFPVAYADDRVTISQELQQAVESGDDLGRSLVSAVVRVPELTAYSFQVAVENLALSGQDADANDLFVLAAESLLQASDYKQYQQFLAAVAGAEIAAGNLQRANVYTASAVRVAAENGDQLAVAAATSGALSAAEVGQQGQLIAAALSGAQAANSEEAILVVLTSSRAYAEDSVVVAAAAAAGIDAELVALAVNQQPAVVDVPEAVAQVAALTAGLPATRVSVAGPFVPSLPEEVAPPGGGGDQGAGPGDGGQVGISPN